MSKRVRCTKCDIYFKDRNDERDVAYEKSLCFNCRFICGVIKLAIASLGQQETLNRTIKLDLAHLQIRKKQHE